jgi:hypothetical protein
MKLTVPALGLGLLCILVTIDGSASAVDQPKSGAPIRFDDETPTFSRDVAPILQRACQECHRVDAMAPMSLVTYQEVRPWAPLIRDRVVRRVMPPWHIDKTVGIQEFSNDISLSDDEIATIVQWVDGGAPEGDPRDLPPQIEWPHAGEWGLAELLGPPDLIVRSSPYTVAANGQDQWWFPDIEFDGLTEERWLRATEFKPAYPLGVKVVHHGHATFARTGERGGVALARYGVGKRWDVMPDNTGVLIPAGPGRISWNLHYFPIGEEVQNDVVEVGLWFYPKGQEPEIATAGERQFLVDGTHTSGPRAGELVIPPHGYLVMQSAHVLQSPAVIHSFRPHAHMRGVGMSMEAIYPDGRREILSAVNNYDHNWQMHYQYADDVKPVLPKGTVLLFHSFYDNTEDNPINPDPDQWVAFGARGVDEMSHAWVGISYIEESEYERLITQRRSNQEVARAQDD